MNNFLDVKNFNKREEYQAEFDRIAKKLLNYYQLKTSSESQSSIYIIRELEFYYYAENHTDFYCHKNEKQLTKSSFYFHRFKDPEKYLRLRQKGIDITFGHKKNGEKAFGGILIRAIQKVGSEEICTGIGKLTNTIINEIGGIEEVPKLQGLDGNVFDKNSSLHLFCSDNNHLKIFKKRRQGLNPKASDSDRFYLDSAYNYFTYPEIIELT